MAVLGRRQERGEGVTRRRLVWWFLCSRLGRAVHLTMARDGNHARCPMCEYVWRVLESDPEFPWAER